MSANMATLRSVGGRSRQTVTIEARRWQGPKPQVYSGRADCLTETHTLQALKQICGAVVLQDPPRRRRRITIEVYNKDSSLLSSRVWECTMVIFI